LIRQLPDLTDMKSEVVIQKSHRNLFDHQLRSTGIKLIEIETVAQLRTAVNDRTAIMHFSNFANAAGQIKVDEWSSWRSNTSALHERCHSRHRYLIFGTTPTWVTIW
jgi:hypothetical protein